MKPRHSLFIFKNFLTFLSIADLQCCVSFQCRAKWISYLYGRFYFHTDHYRVLIGVPCAIYSGCYLVIYFMYSGVYTSVPISQFLPPSLSTSITISLLSTSVTLLLFYSKFICTILFFFFFIPHKNDTGLPTGASGKEPACKCRGHKRCGKIPWRKARQPPPVFLPGESLGQRSLAGYSPQVTKSWTQLND